MTDIAQRAKDIFREEMRELTALADTIDSSFAEVVDALYTCKGKCG